MTGRPATIVVMAKAPVPGRVKTRLCPPCTPHQAAALAEAALADTFDAVLAAPAGRRVVALDGRPGPWLPPGIEVVGQGGGTLDQRIAAVLTASPGPVVVIGMDTPQVGAAGLAGALAELGRPDVDAVLGPAHDGGWWALGLDRPSADDVLGVPMSTDTTGAAQHGRLRSRGRRTVLLPALRDVDTMADARAVAAGWPRTRFAAVLDRLDLPAPAAAPAVPVR